MNREKGDTAELVKYFSHRPEFVPYINLEIIINCRNHDKHPTQDEIDGAHLQVLSQLTNFYNFKLIGEPPKFSSRVPKFERLLGNTTFFYHQLCFIERKQHKLKLRKNSQSKDFLNTFIDFLMKIPPIPPDIFLSINEPQLFDDLRSETREIESLSNLFNRILQKIFLLSPLPLSLENMYLELYGIVDSVCSKIDSKTSYFRIDQTQLAFESIVSCEKLPFKSDIDCLQVLFLNGESGEFMQSIIGVVLKIIHSIQIKKKHSDSALIIMIQRFIFDLVYQKNSFFHKPGRNVIFDLKNITIAELALPLDFCPPLDISKRPIEVFRDDKYYGKAVRRFEAISFFNNPLDILFGIHKTLCSLEKAATHYCNGTVLVFPFEVTFGLFLAVALSSTLDNLHGIAQFVDIYSPQGLSPSFEYAKAKIMACSVQCQDILTNGPNSCTN